MPRGNPNNLIQNTDQTPEEIQENCRKAGIASGEARRKKKLMSQIYAEFLEKEHDIVVEDGGKEKIEGSKLLNRVMSKVLSRGDSAAVSMMKEIREGTEGNKTKMELTGKDGESLNFNVNIKIIDK